MADKTLTYGDVTIVLSYSVFPSPGLHAVNIRCRKYKDTFGVSDAELARLTEVLRNGIDAEARKFDPPTPERVTAIDGDPSQSP